MASPSKSKKTKPATAGKSATLHHRMTAIRRELDDLRAQHGAADLFTATLEELNVVRDEIADATDAMLTACEAIQDTADAIAAKTKERSTKSKLQKINQQTGDIFEACSFQDLTGHRISKISRTVSAVGNTFAGVSKVAGGKSAPRILAKGKCINRIDGDITLEGPQINGPTISQAVIDSLFD